jgi:hypothetical protein
MKLQPLARLKCDGRCEQDNFLIWAERMTEFALTVDMRATQFSLLLAFALKWPLEGVITPLLSFPLISRPTRTFLPSRQYLFSMSGRIVSHFYNKKLHVVYIQETFYPLWRRVRIPPQ